MKPSHSRQWIEKNSYIGSFVEPSRSGNFIKNLSLHSVSLLTICKMDFVLVARMARLWRSAIVMLGEELMRHGRWDRLRMLKYLSSAKRSLKSHQKSLIFEFYDIVHTPDTTITCPTLWFPSHRCLALVESKVGRFLISRTLCCLCSFNHTTELGWQGDRKKTSWNAKLMNSGDHRISSPGSRLSNGVLGLGKWQTTPRRSIKFHNFEWQKPSEWEKVGKIKIYISMIKEIYEFL